jgi:hypothetical protein
MLDHQLLNFMQQVLEGADQLFYHPEQHDDWHCQWFLCRTGLRQWLRIDVLGYPSNNTNNLNSIVMCSCAIYHFNLQTYARHLCGHSWELLHLLSHFATRNATTHHSTFWHCSAHVFPN